MPAAPFASPSVARWVRVCAIDIPLRVLTAAPRPSSLQAVFKVVGSNKRFPVVKDAYVTDESDMAKRSVLDGDSFLPGASASWRFRSPEVEPYMNSQGRGLPWFSVNKVNGLRWGVEACEWRVWERVVLCRGWIECAGAGGVVVSVIMPRAVCR